MTIKSNLRKERLIGAVLTNLSFILMGISLQASENDWTSEQEVLVCIESGMTRESGLAQLTARKMFAEIGVRIKFHEEGKCPANQEGMIRILLNTGVPAERFPGALAYALPYEGVHIEVFVDRIRKMVHSKRVHTLLAHVLVHEITHILQGVNRHSEEGIMKANWDRDDHRRMGWKPLTFTEKDIRLIHFGLETRAAGKIGTQALLNN